MGSGELDVNGAEEGEDAGLEDADEEFEEIERDGDDDAHEVADGFGEAELLAEGDHGDEEVLAGEDVAKETEGEGDGAEEDGDDFDDTDEEEDGEEESGEDAFEAAFDAEGVVEKAEEADFAQRPVEPNDHEEGGDAEREVKVGGGWAEEGDLDVGDAEEGGFLAPADGADAREEGKPVGEEDEEEDGAEEGEGAGRHVAADNAFNGGVKGLDDGLEEVLAWAGDELHLAGGGSGEPEDNSDDDGGYENGVGYPIGKGEG